MMNLSAHTMHRNNTTLDLPLMDIEEYNNEQLRYLLPAMIYTGILMVVGTPGNIIVLYVYFFKWRRSTSRMFILYLAALDLINCLTTLPMEIYIMRYSLMLDKPFLCKLSRSSTYVMNSSSASILVGIAMDRFKRICRPYQKTFSEQISKYICIGAVLLSISLTWPSFILYGTRKISVEGVEGRACLIENQFDKTPYPLAYYIFMGFSTLFIFSLLSILYYFVGLQIYKHRNFKLKNCSHVQKIMEDKSTVKSTSHKSSKDIVGSKESNEKSNCSKDIPPVIEIQEEPNGGVNTLSPYHLDVHPEPSHDAGTSCGLLNVSSNVIQDLNSDRSIGQFSNKGVELDSKALEEREDRNGSPPKQISPKRSPKRTKSKRKKRVRYLLVRGASTLNASNRGKCVNCLTVRIGKSTLMLFLITLAYIISFLPFYVVAIIRQSNKNFVANLSAAGVMAYHLFLRSYLLSSAINPIIYSFCNAQFREYCIDLFRRLCIKDPERTISKFGRR